MMKNDKRYVKYVKKDFLWEPSIRTFYRDRGIRTGTFNVYTIT
jgi:hypothetical protein